MSFKVTAIEGTFTLSSHCLILSPFSNRGTIIQSRSALARNATASTPTL